MNLTDLWNQYGSAILALAAIALTAAHARGYKLPILSSILDALLGTSPSPAVPGSPAAPAAPGHPVLDALAHLLANVLAGRAVAGMQAATSPDGNTVTATLTLVPKG